MNKTIQLSFDESKAATVERERLEDRFKPMLCEDPTLGPLVSYKGNKRLPLFRLYRYKEAYSLEFVERFLDFFHAGSRDFVIDPFAGMGTTLFAAMSRCIPSVGLDRLPIAAFVANTLPTLLEYSPGTLVRAFEKLSKRIEHNSPAHIALDVPLIGKAFDDRTLLRLRKWKATIDEMDSPLKEVFLLLFFAILEETSLASNDGQFLRLKPNKQPMWPDQALRQKVLEAETDILAARMRWPEYKSFPQFKPIVHTADARSFNGIALPQSPTILITSPPYANRYDYTRSYALELCFHFVKNANELRDLRRNILRSHIEAQTTSDDIPPHPAVSEVIKCLSQKSLNNPRIPIMLNTYFVDMAQSIREWEGVLAPGARVAMVVDNVRFEGEMVPVDLILSELAEWHGFTIEQIFVARYKGNSSQQMGKYGRVPVRESVVIWRKLRTLGRIFEANERSRCVTFFTST